MRRIVLVIVVAAAAALAQNTSIRKSATMPAKAAHSTPATKSKPVAATAPVITIHGLCDSRTSKQQGTKAGRCATVLTRRDFEAFVDVLNATTTRGVDPPYYRNVAEGYTALLVSAKAAEKAGVDKNPRFDHILDTTRLRALAGMYRTKRYKEALQVPAEQIAAYYKKNLAGYEEVDLERFVLPKNNTMNLNDLAFREKSKRLAEELHARAVKGEDIVKLEKEGLDALGQKDIPMVVIGVRRGQLEDKADKEVFALDPGKVTSLLDEVGLWTFFKRTGRHMLSLDDVKDEIRGKLFRERLEAIDKSLHDAVHVEYSEAYFGRSPAAGNKAGSGPKAATTAKPEEKSSEPRKVAPTQVIITIHGLCGSPKEQSAVSSCATRVTREQFEDILKLTSLTSSSPTPPRSVANGYVDELIYGRAGEQAGLEKNPHFPEMMRLARLRALTDMYRLTVDQQAHQVSIDQMQAFYKKNLASFEEVQLRYVSIPREKPAKSKDPDWDATAKSLASQLRERAAKGEDMDKLTGEAYEKLGKKDSASSLMAPIRRGALEEKAEREVFGMQLGQVTTVQEYPPAYVFYKLESRRTIPLEEAKPEIALKFYRQNLDKQAKTFSSGIRAEYNEDYFPRVPPAGSRASAAQPGGSAK